MLVGHYACAIALRGSFKRPGLPLWFLAVIFCDLACFLLALAGLETFEHSPGFTRHFPYRLTSAPFSHSFLGALGLGALFSLASRLAGIRLPAALALGLAVFSHFPLDWLVHGPDLAWAGETPHLGLALWNTPWIAEGIEITMLVLAVTWLLRQDARVSRARTAVLTFLLLFAGVARSLAPRMPTDLVVAALSGIAAVGLTVSIAWICDRNS